MAPVTGKVPTRGEAAWSLVRFGLLTLLVSAALSLLAMPWTELPAWKVVRRCVSLAAALALWLSVTRWEGRSLRSLGVREARAGKRQFLIGLGIGVWALGLLLALGLASGTCVIHVTPDRFRLWRTVLTFIPGAVLVSVLEELVFRGFILQRLVVFSTPVAVAVSSLLYALVHLKASVLTVAAASELIGLFIFGGVLSLCYLVTKQLYLSMGLHASLAYGVRVNKLLVEFPDASLAWLTGTHRLVNGVSSWALLLVLAVGVAWWGRRGRAMTMAAMVAVVLMAATPARADQELEPFWGGSLRKLGRGIVNLATCPLEIVQTPLHVKAREGVTAAFSGGLVEGSLRMIQRGVIGAFEVVTFYAEIPPGFAPLMQPEFAWEPQ